MYGIPQDRKSNNRQFQEAATQRKAANDTQFFWELVARHNAGHPIGPKKTSKAQEEHFLFGKKSSETSSGIIDDNIPVQRSGPKADEINALESFESLRDVAPSSVTRCLELLKFDTPTPIQKHAIPLGLSGLDLMCCAQTGSGKTLAFLIPVVTAINSRKESQGNAAIDSRGALPKAIILAPTRELASQIHLDARRLMFGSNLRSVCVYGGNDIRNQLVELCIGSELIVATPGRLNDLVERGIVSLEEVSFLVLDEADRMLDMGFEPQIRRIVQESNMPMGENRQTFMFSATFPPEIQTLAREFLRNYVWIAVGRVGSTVDNIKQQVLLASADPQEKIKLLLSVLDHTDGRTLVFVQKRKTASWLCETMRNMFGIAAEEIHGDRSQAQRESALKAFRDGNIRILVATDVAARGLDVPAVTHVIQFDMPLSAEDFDVYVHRIGRTGRAGMSGLATSFFVPGREVGEGNGKIGPLLVRLLRENSQEIPDWLGSLEEGHGGYHNNHQYQRKGNSNYGNNGHQYQSNGGRFQQSKFGYSDSRSNQQNVLYQNNYSNNRGNNNMMQSDAYQQGNVNRGVYNNRQSQMNPQTQQNRMNTSYTQQSYYTPYNSQNSSIQSYAPAVPNPPAMHSASQAPYVPNATASPLMQSGYPAAANTPYYDPYVAAAYMTAAPNNGMMNGMMETPSPYAQQAMTLQQPWMVSNPTQVPVQMQVVPPAAPTVSPGEVDRSPPAGNAMNNYARPHQDYAAHNSRQQNPRGQIRNDNYHSDRNYNNANNSRQYYNNYNNGAATGAPHVNNGYSQYPQSQRQDYRPRDGGYNHYQGQQQQHYQHRNNNQYRPQGGYQSQQYKGMEANTEDSTIEQPIEEYTGGENTGGEENHESEAYET